MTGLIRKAAFLAVCSGMIASVAMAGAPSWGTSTQATVIKVGGTVGGVGQAASAVSYTIRDANNIPVFNTKVKLDFSLCTGITLCAAQDVGITKVGSTLEGLTNVSGVITFKVRGFATTGVGYSGTCVTVTLPDNPAAGNGNQLVASSFDLNGAGGVDASDLSIWGVDANNCPGGTHRGRSDYNGSGSCPGGIDASDLSLWGVAANQSPLSCTP